jgi:hypothetical protein
MKKLYGKEPVFIFDPNNDTNRPVKGFHNNAITFWEIYPESLKRLFIKAFTTGIIDPENGRVRESQWRTEMANLRDCIIYCSGCGEENFYDKEYLKQTGKLKPCWSCRNDSIIPPYRIKLDKKVVMLNHDTKLYSHHTDKSKTFNLDNPVAEVTRHPKDPNIWGLKNLSAEKWVAVMTDGQKKDVLPGQNVTLNNGVKIQFGNIEGEVKY